MNNHTSSINKFYDANEGFKKGNLSKCIYKPYKHYKEKEVVGNRKLSSLSLLSTLYICTYVLNEVKLKRELTLKMYPFFI